MNNNIKINYDFLIIGAGIIGLAIARELVKRHPNKKIAIIEKESDVAFHGSGRNSGVLHAGFYYTSDSLKAKFCKDGNQLLKDYCKKNNLKLKPSGKVVVATNKEELKVLYELEKRGLKNDVEVKIIDEKTLAMLDENVKTYRKALYSPNTATIDPIEICKCIKKKILANGVKIYFNEKYESKINTNSIKTNKRIFNASKIINCSGLYADKIAKEFNFSKNYVIIPFKGIYLTYNDIDLPIKKNIYPVPNLKNPFLGIHYTITVDNVIKIGPTAIPAFWRENYKGFKNFSISELFSILTYELKLLTTNSFNFRILFFDEIKKYNKKYVTGLAAQMVRDINRNKFNTWSKPGIRAQLLNTKTLELVQDFVVEGDDNSTHVLNTVSPAFTCSMPFAAWVVKSILKIHIERFFIFFINICKSIN